MKDRFLKDKFYHGKYRCAMAFIFFVCMTTATVAAPVISTVVEAGVNTNTMKIALHVTAEESLTAMPGKLIDYQASLENTGDYVIYLRAIVEKSWANKKATGEPEKTNTALSYVKLLSDHTEDWIMTQETEDTYIYYYRYPVKPGEETTNFIKALEISPLLSNSNKDYVDGQLKLHVIGQGVQVPLLQDGSLQVDGVSPAWELEWGMSVTDIQRDGTIEQIQALSAGGDLP